MNINIGKWVKNLVTRRQKPKKIERKLAPQLEKRDEYTPHYQPQSLHWIYKHNASQAEKAKKRKASRVKNKMRKANRKINRKGKKS